MSTTSADSYGEWRNIKFITQMGGDAAAYEDAGTGEEARKQRAADNFLQQKQSLGEYSH